MLRICEILFLKIRIRAILIVRPSDEEKPPWSCSPRNPVGACRACRRRAESSSARGRLSQIVKYARPSSALAVGRRRTAARGLLMLGAASATQRLKRRALGVGWKEENFPPCKLLKTHETELESHRILRCSEDPDATAATISPNRKGRGGSFLSASFAAIGAECGEAKFSCSQTLEKAQNGEGISQAVALPSGSRRRSGERCGFTISSAWTPGKRSPGTGKLPSV
jgi:hypothetical protein